MKTIFKKGDYVQCEDYGIGIVDRIDLSNKTYPVDVEFTENGGIVAYTSDGSSVKNHPPTLKVITELEYNNLL